MADDPALTYNYETDPRWLEHLEKLSLNSTDAGNDTALLTLAKQSWYQHNVVCNFRQDVSARLQWCDHFCPGFFPRILPISPAIWL